MQSKLSDGSVLVVGKCTGDAEYKRVGQKDSPVTSFSLIVGKRQDTTTIFANCKAWYRWAEYAKHIKKGDQVLVIGKLESREYNGKTYTDLVADWIDYLGSDETSHQELAPNGVAFPAGVTFEEDRSSGDGGLPF